MVDPTRRALASAHEGEEIRDPGADADLAVGIEQLIREEAPRQHAGWPGWATTDGFTVDLCVKVSRRSIELFGLCWMDFSGTKFPVRARVELTPDHSDLAMCRVWFGDVDPGTGTPPQLPSGSMIISSTDDDARSPVPELLVGHRLRRDIVWTLALTWPLPAEPE